MNREHPGEPTLPPSTPATNCSTRVFRNILGPELLTRDVLVAAGLTTVSVALHLFRMLYAGGLWRDEAATANLASDFSLRRIVFNSQHELFPALMPALLRAFSAFVGSDDAGLRLFGAFVGVGILASIWVSVWWARRGAPLLSVALLGFNGAFIVGGDAIRGYGIGILFMVLTTGAIWQLTQRLSRWSIAGAAFLSIASVQCTFINSVLLFAICVSAICVTMLRKAFSKAVVLCTVGAAAAASLLPYWGPVSAIKQWDMVVKRPGALWATLHQAAGNSVSIVGWVWAIVAMVVVAAAWAAQKKDFGIEPKERDLLLFCGLALPLGFAGYLWFLHHTEYPPHVWYFVGLLGFAALMSDLVVDTFRARAPVCTLRVALAVLVACVSLWPAVKTVQVRQTNIDLVAESLNSVCSQYDLVVVDPWHCGLSFRRYYLGHAPWLCVPEIGHQVVHRFDIIKSCMMMQDQDEPIRPVLQQIRTTLQSGHRVWLATYNRLPAPGIRITSLPPAPNNVSGWWFVPFEATWTAKVGLCLERNALQGAVVPVQRLHPISQFEEMDLFVFEGWRDLRYPPESSSTGREN